MPKRPPALPPRLPPRGPSRKRPPIGIFPSPFEAMITDGWMPHATLGHSGRTLTYNGATVVAFVLINAAASARVCATWHTALMATLVLVAGALWIASFAIFELVYGEPTLLTRREGS